MRKQVLITLLFVLLSAGASAGNVVTYSYDSAGNRVTKVVASPSKGNGSDSQATTPQTSQPEESPTQTDSTDTQSE
ncbi:MAG: hypothetical protein IKI89_03220 [Bacteroidales bacterium]|nr:hypothetical protein [Bacteroidales bacterium]